MVNLDGIKNRSLALCFIFYKNFGIKSKLNNIDVQKASVLYDCHFSNFVPSFNECFL